MIPTKILSYSEPGKIQRDMLCLFVSYPTPCPAVVMSLATYLAHDI